MNCNSRHSRFRQCIIIVFKTLVLGFGGHSSVVRSGGSFAHFDPFIYKSSNWEIVRSVSSREQVHKDGTRFGYWPLLENCLKVDSAFIFYKSDFYLLAISWIQSRYINKRLSKRILPWMTWYLEDNMYKVVSFVSCAYILIQHYLCRAILVNNIQTRTWGLIS